MLIQINDREGNSLGILQVPDAGNLFPAADFKQAIAAAAYACVEEEDDNNDFWDLLEVRMLDMGIQSERLFLEEINL